MNGRDKVPWSQEIWDRIDQAVHAECRAHQDRHQLHAMHGPIDDKARTVPSDRVEVLEAAAVTARASRLRAAQAGPIPLLDVDEAAETPIIEIQAQFQLTPQQVHDEQKLMTAVTLADTSRQSSFAGRGPVDFSRWRRLGSPLLAQNRVQLSSRDSPGLACSILPRRRYRLCPSNLFRRGNHRTHRRDGARMHSPPCRERTRSCKAVKGWPRRITVPMPWFSSTCPMPIRTRRLLQL